MDKAVKVCLRKYAVGKGRATRSEYWYFQLFSFIAGFAAGFVEVFTKTHFLSNLVSLALLIPGIAAGVRRMHDTDHRGWFVIIPFYNLYLLVKPSDEEANRFGDPAPLVSSISD